MSELYLLLDLHRLNKNTSKWSLCSSVRQWLLLRQWHLPRYGSIKLACELNFACKCLCCLLLFNFEFFAKCVLKCRISLWVENSKFLCLLSRVRYEIKLKTQVWFVYCSTSITKLLVLLCVLIFLWKAFLQCIASFLVRVGYKHILLYLSLKTAVSTDHCKLFWSPTFVLFQEKFRAIFWQQILKYLKFIQSLRFDF